jgi:hypothetical protein
MADEADGFLQRWSRRKQEAARAAPVVARPDPAAEAKAAEAAAAETRRKADAEEAERAELLARLPRLEDLAAGSDFRQFMHPLVPPALRSAALARMWTLDPAIRDFVGPARDYAWDWNVPGGVPGGGPAPSLAEVQETLRKLTARLDVAEAPLDGEPARDEILAPEPAAEVAPVAAAEPQAEPPPDALGSESPEPATPEPEMPRRRHGGAMPV